MAHDCDGRLPSGPASGAASRCSAGLRTAIDPTQASQSRSRVIAACWLAGCCARAARRRRRTCSQVPTRGAAPRSGRRPRRGRSRPRHAAGHRPRVPTGRAKGRERPRASVPPHIAAMRPPRRRSPGSCSSCSTRGCRPGCPRSATFPKGHEPNPLRPDQERVGTIARRRAAMSTIVVERVTRGDDTGLAVLGPDTRRGPGGCTRKSPWDGVMAPLPRFLTGTRVGGIRLLRVAGRRCSGCRSLYFVTRAAEPAADAVEARALAPAAVRIGGRSSGQVMPTPVRLLILALAIHWFSREPAAAAAGPAVLV